MNIYRPHEFAFTIQFWEKSTSGGFPEHSCSPCSLTQPPECL